MRIETISETSSLRILNATGYVEMDSWKIGLAWNTEARSWSGMSSLQDSREPTGASRSGRRRLNVSKGVSAVASPLRRMKVLVV